jgi:hypothetical protein
MIRSSSKPMAARWIRSLNTCLPTCVKPIIRACLTSTRRR